MYKLIGIAPDRDWVSTVFRVMELATGNWQDMDLVTLHDQQLPLHKGKCFIPSLVNHPTISLSENHHYYLPHINMRTGECYKNDHIIVLAQHFKPQEPIQYLVTDFQGGLTWLLLQEALNYAKEAGYWNATVQDGLLVPRNKLTPFDYT